MFRDPLLRKSHAHKAQKSIPDPDEQLEEWLLEQQQHDDADRKDFEEDSYYEY